MRRPLFLITLLVSASASALPPGSPLAPGANHHIGDESFIEKFGRPPNDHDAERVRMTTHLQHVRDWLASRPATRPELAAKRAAILKSFDAYIAKGTTPKNQDLPWRTPVFIDEEGTICAVGYLIEQSVGRDLPEKIAKTHRYDFIEDIAAAMPEVRDWVAQSGFTLEEIASIQPAYSAPQTDAWRTWDLAKYPAKDGPSNRYGEGMFKNNKMEGAWKVYDGGEGKERLVVGRGTMKRGRGDWTSFYPTGEKLAEGRFADNEPDGRWRIWHKSGNLAAEGQFSGGTRTGKWRFYYDTPAKTPIAVGRFGADGSVSGRWNHFDSEGKLLARSWIETPATWVAYDTDYRTNGGEGSMLEVLPGKDGVAHAIHQGTPGKDVEYNSYKLEAFSKGKEHLYISNDLGSDVMFGMDGSKLSRDDDGTWHATSCHWSTMRKVIAQEGDVARLHGLLSTDARRRARAAEKDEYSDASDPGPACSGEVAVSPARAKRLDALLASRDKIRSATPQMVRSLVIRQEDDQEQVDADAEPERAAELQREKLEGSDLARVLAGNMAMFIEWPHVDRRFDEVYATVAGRYSADWANHSEQDDDVNYVEPPRTN